MQHSKNVEELVPLLLSEFVVEGSNPEVTLLPLEVLLIVLVSLIFVELLSVMLLSVILLSVMLFSVALFLVLLVSIVLFVALASLPVSGIITGSTVANGAPSNVTDLPALVNEPSAFT